MSLTRIIGCKLRKYPKLVAYRTDVYTPNLIEFDIITEIKYFR